MRRPPIVLALAVTSGCYAQLADPQISQQSQLDAANGTDSAPIDATPIDATIDARPCDGGQARGTDPSTGTCVVFFSAPLPYLQAETACNAIAAKLVVIKSAQTNTHVLGLVGNVVDAFIGASDRTTEGTFLWLDNAADPLSGGFTNWRAGEPNNGGVAGEDCAIIEGELMGTWDDRPCAGIGGAYPYVCQY
ncbi:MAG: C-type lectin domain-containing protein [Kofleriaceae bacterium]